MTADLLRRAADRVEQLAADCPTNSRDYQHLCAWLQRGRTVPAVTARWWAVMGPQVAEPLAAWLRTEAQVAELVDRRPDPIAELVGLEQDQLRPYSTPAYELARAILGEQP